MDKRKLFLILWLFGMLLPLEWLTKGIPLVRRAFDLVVSTELAHIIGHLILFSGLAVLALYVFRLPQTWQTALLLALGVLAVGLGQEYLQLQVKGRSFGWPEVFDLGVDLIGAGLGWWAYRRVLGYSRYLRIAYYILRGG